jgi:hypothetical protein
VTLFRCFRWRRAARVRDPGGPLWIARELQGDGRHDEPALYGCLYVTEVAVSAVVERLARFQGNAIGDEDFLVGEDVVGLATIELDAGATLLDLDDPRTLVSERLRPSAVATHDRSRTQGIASRCFERHADVAGLRWWSTFESAWHNVTLWDRSLALLGVRRIEPLTLEHDVVKDAAAFLRLPLG